MNHPRPLSFRRLATTGLVLALCQTWTACVPSSDADEAVEGDAVALNQLPGAAVYPADLQARLRVAVEARGEGYEPRTHHLRPDGRAVYTNRLIFEDSPYLIQHAHNPVNWYPWGPEAFAKAVREEKPIFLSIGYSTCHWCHVMERESFESEAIAKILNERFVSIKIDRERRPDIDDIYMTAVHLQRNRGGWPMSSFLTPEGKPFFGGTYFPPAQFTELLNRVTEVWNAQREQLLTSADRLAEAVKEVTAARGKAEQVGQEAFANAVTQLLSRTDKVLGGFGNAPKFPHESELLFLLGRVLRTGNREALAAVVKSLDAMARGGIYDQVGGGFHRYSTDAGWLVPHFEKMLYNQAHLSRAYLAAYRLTGNAFFGRVGRQTLDYVLREMTAPGGGFYSATDADSEGEEGLFFIWTPDELHVALEADDAKLTIDLFGVTEAGNFEGHNILFLGASFEEYAAQKGMQPDDLLARVDRIRETLWQEREKRIHPIRDDKVLTSWNGMMITAFAAGYEALGEKRYLAAARQAAEFLWKKNHKGGGELWRVHLEGRSSIPALQDDYAYYAEALLALYDQTAEAVWLERARQVADAMLERFWDSAEGGFFMSAEKVDPHLIARPKSPSDGAIPSGNSVAVRVLGHLAARTGETLYGNRANAALAAFSGFLQQQPSGYSYMLLGADEIMNGQAGPRQYAAAGTVQATARLEGERGAYRLRVGLRIRDGWHVNAHEPLQQELVPTVLRVGEEDGWRLDDTAYPEGEKVSLGFQDEPLLVYEGEVEISSRLAVPASSAAGALAVPVKLKIQACNDELCLRPEEIELEVPLGGRS